MKNFIRYFLSLTLGVAFISTVSAQERYLDPIYDVEVSDIQVAGSNYTILPWLFAAQQGVPGNTAEQPLIYQTYSPVGDTETERPLVLYLHTGNFLPFPLNEACGGTIADSTNVEIATRLASMGYVVAVVDYRLGWLPTHPVELVRRYSLINGAYRGVQDVNTFIRYFKRSITEEGNRFGIDGDKITVWGQGTGGYLSLAAAFLNDETELTATSDPSKFLLPLPNGGMIPMVIPGYNGNISGTNELAPDTYVTTVVDSNYNAISSLPVGDTLSKPNWPEFKDDQFALAVNMGGALGDSLWINDNDNDIPVISYHVKTDPLAPYETDVLLVRTQIGDQPVVEVSGSYHVQRILNRRGQNDIFNTIPEGNDPIGDAINPEFPGLFELNNTPNDSSAPWEWANPDTPAIPGDCNFDAASARTYIDSIVGFFAPRACVALDLNCNFSTNTNEIHLDKNLMTVSPNPATNLINVSFADRVMNAIEVYSLAGSLVMNREGIEANNTTINVASLSEGMYIIKAYLPDGVTTKKVMIQK